MRILYLNPCGQMGGAETSLREVFAGIREAEPDWELCLVLAEHGPLADKARELGVDVMVEPFPAALARVGEAGQRPLLLVKSILQATLPTLQYIPRLRTIIRRVQPDLIHTNGFKMHLLGGFARFSQIPVVWHIHDYVSTRRFMSRLLRFGRKRCSAAIVNSKSVGRDLTAVIPGLNVTPIYNAINFERYTPQGKTADLDAASGLGPAAPDVVRVGLVATFARWKGHKVFLQALSRLPKELPVRGYVIGGPIYRTDGSQFSLAELQQEAIRLGLVDKVGFTGFLDDTSQAMRALDIVVHASTEPEPFGMVIIEAMACAKPVIVSQAGGAEELFDDERTAIGHPAGDVQALAAQVERLVNDPALRQRLSEAAHEAAVRSFHTRRLASEVAALYRRCHAESQTANPIPAFTNL